MGIEVIRANVISDAMRGHTRQYLAGKLTLPQLIDYLDDPDIEVGMSWYSKGAFEPAHRHTRAKEYQLVLEGLTEYVDTENGVCHTFGSGDFYVIYPGTCYIQRIKAGTRILFFKYPSGNDKELVEVSAEWKQWAETPLRVKRRDLILGEGAPAPNSLKPAVAVAVFGDSDKILLVRRRDSGFWSMPGGTMEMSDSIESCGSREVLEETGALVEILGLIGTYSNPGHIVAYTDGEVRREFSVLLEAKLIHLAGNGDDESTAMAWVAEGQLDQFEMVASQEIRVKDAFDFRRTGKTRLL